MTGYSLTQFMQELKATNNNRMTVLAMTGPQKRMAEKAVARGLVTKYHMNFPGYGMTVAYSAA